MEDTRFLNEKEVAGIIGISVKTLQNDRFFRRGIPFARVGSSVRYSHQAVLEYMRAHTVQVTPK